MDDYHRIYNLWHEYASNKDVPHLLSLYADHAVLESPLIPILMQQETGILRGKKAIEAFFIEGTQRRPNALVRWYRTGKYYVTDNTLVWEYPRQTPDGDQIDILELMEIESDRIINHRIYWGWFGVQLLLSNQKAESQ